MIKRIGVFVSTFALLTTPGYGQSKTDKQSDQDIKAMVAEAKKKNQMLDISLKANAVVFEHHRANPNKPFPVSGLIAVTGNVIEVDDDTFKITERSPGNFKPTLIIKSADVTLLKHRTRGTLIARAFCYHSINIACIVVAVPILVVGTLIGGHYPDSVTH